MATRVLTFVLFILAMITSSALTVLFFKKNDNAGGISKEAAGKIIVEYIEENPEIIIKGIQRAQAKQEEEKQADAQGAISDLKAELENAKGDAVIGNPNGSVTLVAFHDHNCGYCLKSVPDIMKLVENDKDLKVVIKDLPILGPVSVEKAKVSLAVFKMVPEKWYDFYLKVSQIHPRTLDQTLEVATAVGIDRAKIEAELESDDIKNKIAETHSIADRLGIRGTPAFVVNDTLIPGAVGYDVFAEEVAKARSK